MQRAWILGASFVTLVACELVAGIGDRTVGGGGKAGHGGSPAGGGTAVAGADAGGCLSCCELVATESSEELICPADTDTWNTLWSCMCDHCGEWPQAQCADLCSSPTSWWYVDDACAICICDNCGPGVAQCGISPCGLAAECP